MMMRLLYILLFIAPAAGAQNFGGFPPSTNWRQLNSDTARIIFTEGAQAQTQRIATLVHKMAADTPFAIGNRLRKIDILLDARTT